MTNSQQQAPSLFDGSIIGPAILGAFAKLDPRALVRNPVMFVTAIGALLTTIGVITAEGDRVFIVQLALWLWFTVLFANFAEASNGRIGLELMSQDPGLVILDLGLPDVDGLDLLRTIRARNEAVPIVVLSSRGGETAKVAALDLGADDYVTKPFGMEELLARMRAAVRHQSQVQGERPIFRLGDLSVDLVRRIVRVADEEVRLSPNEYDLLRVLVQHAGKVLTHRFLLGQLWDPLTDAQYLRVYVRQLRRKIEADPERPRYLLTETGIGYRLRAPD